MVPDISLLGAQHSRIGLALLSSTTSLKKKEMDSIRHERSKVINIIWGNLLRHPP